MRYYDVLKDKAVSMRATTNPNPAIHTPEGVWVIVEKRDRTERCRFLVNESDYEKLVKPHRWNVGGVKRDRIYHAARIPTGSKSSTVLLARWLVNPQADLEVDHINQNSLDNRRGNLRVVTRKQNEENKSREGGSSEYRGVHRDSMCPNKPWRAAVTHNYKQYNSPRFPSEEEAISWAINKRAEMFTHSKDAK